jgi:hypothetical protein
VPVLLKISLSCVQDHPKSAFFRDADLLPRGGDPSDGSGCSIVRRRHMPPLRDDAVADRPVATYDVVHERWSFTSSARARRSTKCGLSCRRRGEHLRFDVTATKLDRVPARPDEAGTLPDTHAPLGGKR